MIKVIAAALLAFIASSAHATEQWHAGLIKSIYPLSEGSFVLVFTNDSTLCGNSPKYHYVVVDSNGVTAEGSTKIFAAAMLAASMGKELHVAFDDSSSSCYVNRAIVAVN